MKRKTILTQAKDNAGLISAVAGIALLAGSFTQLEKMAWLIRVPSVAYAAQQQVEDTASKFDRYLIQQQAYTEALQGYVQQQQQQQAPMQQQFQSNIKEWVNSQGVMYCCDEARQDCRRDESWWECGR